jgi:hypothetical protein
MTIKKLKKLADLEKNLEWLKNTLKDLESDLEDRKDVDNFEKQFDAYLDEIYEDVEILGNTYGNGWALKRIDPIAYDQELINWVDANIDDLLLNDRKAKDILGLIDDLTEKIENIEEEIENYED